MFQKVQTPMGEVIVRVSDFASIPADTANKDYQEYLLWVAEGNEPVIVEAVNE